MSFLPRRLLCQGVAMARTARKKRKTTLGLREKVAIRAVDGKKWRMFSAKIDTGAVWSRIGARKAANLALGPILDVIRVKTGSGKQRRLLVPASVRIGRYQIAARLSISMQRGGVLIGTRTMGGRFTVDPKKQYLTGRPPLK
jgi:hypothetical protein